MPLLRQQPCGEESWKLKSAIGDGDGQNPWTICDAILSAKRSYPVIAVDLNADRRNLALELGADYALIRVVLTFRKSRSLLA